MEVREDGRARADSGQHRSAIMLSLRLVGPYVIYTVLNARLHNDLLALAIGAAVPLVVGAAIALRKHRIDAALAFSALSLLISLAIAAAIGHGSTILKLRGAVAPAVLGITFLVLAAGPASLRTRALRALGGMGTKRGQPRRPATGQPLEPGHRAPVAAHLQLLMTLWGFGLLLLSAVHVTIVFSVSTADYLVASRVASLGLVGALVLGTRTLGTHWTRGGSSHTNLD